jgi:hypothetical protein
MSCRTAFVEPIFIVRWQTPTLEDLTLIQQEVERARKRVGRMLIYVAIVPADADPPDPPVRKAMIDSMDTVLEHCEVIYFAMEGRGFKHSVLRSALAGILLVAGRRGRVIVHVSASHAITEAARRAGVNESTILRSARARGMLD